MMDYDVVVVTRNRPDALELSLPLMLGQHRPPARLVVVDASDDHPAVRQVVEAATQPYDVPVTLLASRAGTTHQRNVGLEHVRSPVVMYPDDDALWFPGAAEAIMRIYERDEQGAIGAVCAAPSPTAPPGVLEAHQNTYRMSRRDRIKQLVGRQRAVVERVLFPDPFHLHGQSRWSVQPVPDWLEQENAVLVEWMTGFRMTFRSDVIKALGFNELFADYGGFEDVDASFRVMQQYLIVGARNARVYHHRRPGARSSGLGMGMRQVLNRAYLIRRFAPADAPARRRLGRYNWYKCLQYLLECHTAYGRARLRGAWRARRCVPALLAADDDELDQRYLELRARCLAGVDES